MALPSFLHSLPQIEWSERGVCAILACPTFARCMHLSCVESSMYVLTFTFSLRCFIFHRFFLGPGVLQCVVYNFAWFCLHFCIVFPDWMVWREVCAILVRPPFARCMHLSCVESSMLTFTFWLALLHFSLFFLGSWCPPVCFLQFCMVLPSFLHSPPRLNGLERGVCHLSAPPICKMYVPVLVWKVPCICWPSLLACAASFFIDFSWVLESFNVFSTILHGSAFIFA